MLPQTVRGHHAVGVTEVATAAAIDTTTAIGTTVGQSTGSIGGATSKSATLSIPCTARIQILIHSTASGLLKYLRWAGEPDTSS